jgi:hypothetical protein
MRAELFLFSAENSFFYSRKPQDPMQKTKIRKGELLHASESTYRYSPYFTRTGDEIYQNQYYSIKRK